MMVVSAAATAANAMAANKAAKTAAGVDTAVGNYNSRVDEAQAQQTELDAGQNVRAIRQEEGVYLSRQKSAYASAGVLTSSGSPLAAEAHTAGAFEQRAQQEWSNSQRTAAQMRSQGQVGQLYAGAQAQADRTRGTIALINGAASVARDIGGAYSAGAGGGGGAALAGNFSGADMFDNGGSLAVA
jgi:hypothetical protein